MLTIYNSNKVEILKELTVNLINISPLEGVFTQEQILVQSAGMTKYLMQEIAGKSGICANIKFPLVSTFMWDLYHITLPTAPKNSSFSKSSMRWYLVRLIPSLIDHPEFKKLKSYLGNDESLFELRVHQLSTSVADLFDGYQVYRPEMVITWQGDDYDRTLIKGQEWQLHLWRKLSELIKSENANEPDRSELFFDFIKRIEQGKITRSATPELPERLWIFGVSTLSPSQLKTIEYLGRVIDIHYMVFNPSHLYWGDIKDKRTVERATLQQNHKAILTEAHTLFDTNEADELCLDSAVGNPLLASYGKIGRDNTSLLSEIEMKEDIAAFATIEGDCLLNRIQRDIFNLEDRTNYSSYEDSFHKTGITSTDTSIVISDCYSPIREVEELHRHLLGLFDSNPDLKPRDVIVMCADIDKFSPHITAIFGNVPKYDSRYIPFSISDKTANNEHPMVSAFLSIIDVANTRYTTSDVLSLLKNKATLEKFGISEGEYDDIYSLVNDVGVRWGLDSGTSSEIGLPEMNINTWSFGIQRLLFGFAIHSEQGDYQSVLPFDLPINISHQTIGKLAAFIDALRDSNRLLKGVETPIEWLKKLHTICDTFFQPTAQNDYNAIDVIRRSIEKLSGSVELANYHDDVPFLIVSNELSNSLTSEQLSQRFLAGQLNFCTLMPMRSIPFKVVCMLGMNDGIYPKVGADNKNDIVALHPKIGDRAHRESDRYMFLEAFLSAEEQLYISFTGRSIKNGQPRNKSILIQELLDYIGSSFCIEGDEPLSADASEERLLATIVSEKAMTPYSPLNFSGTQPYFFDDWIQDGHLPPQDFCSTPLAIDEKELQDGDTYKLNLSELMKFWKLPAKHFFNRRLKSELSIESRNLQNDEPFDLDNLEKYKLRTKWLESLLSKHSGSGDSGDVVLRNAVQSGTVPHGAIGELCILDEKYTVEELAQRISELQDSTPKKIDVDTTIQTSSGETIRLQGTIRDAYDDHIICYRGGKVRVFDIFDAWIRRLVLAAQGIEKSVYVIGLEKIFMFKAEHLTTEKAQEYLSVLVDGYYIGLRAPLPYLPDVAFKAWDSATLDEFCLKKMKAEYKQKYADNKIFGDRHVPRAFNGWSEELAASIHSWGARVLSPCMDHLTEQK